MSEFIDHPELEDIPEAEAFYFESDHLALRANSDYTSILRTIAILETQRSQVTKAIDKLAVAERKALENPEEFLKELTSGQLKDLPGPVNVVDVPKINFEKYGVNIPELLTEADIIKTSDGYDLTVRGRVFDQSKPETFNQLWTCEEQKRLEELLIEYPPEPIEMRRFAKIARALGNRTTKQVASRLQKFFKKLHSAGMPVPGRIPKSNRVYVSKANRITKQALRPTTFFPANHVPVNINDDDDLNGVSLDPNWYRKGYSTNNVPSDNGGGGSGGTPVTRRAVIVDNDSDNEDTSRLDPQSESSMMLRLVLRIKKDKEKDDKVDRKYCEHDGYKCDFCLEEPIIGTRWHCTHCRHTSIDFCSDCLLSQLYSEKQHHLTHKFVAMRMTTIDAAAASSSVPSRFTDDDDSDDGDGDNADEDGSGNGGGGGSGSGGGMMDDDESSNKFPSSSADEQSQSNFYDKDYLPMNFNKTDYNYLDPNFMPE